MKERRRAELYAALHRGLPGDLAFYRQVCAGAAEVLELGVGYGRIALTLARAGHRVVGLDVDRGLLGLARDALEGEEAAVRGRLTLKRASMADFELSARFDRVIVPFNALFCLLSAEEVRRCLHAVHRHLVPGGRLALDVYRADELHREGEAGQDDFEPVVALADADGADTLDVFERSEWRPSEQRLDTTYRFVSRTDGTHFDQVIEQRYLLVAELEELLVEAGFRPLVVAGGFGGEPADESAAITVIVAERLAFRLPCGVAGD